MIIPPGAAASGGLFDYTPYLSVTIFCSRVNGGMDIDEKIRL